MSWIFFCFCVWQILWIQAGEYRTPEIEMCIVAFPQTCSSYFLSSIFFFLLQIRARKLQFCGQSSSLVSSNSFFSLFMCFFPITYQNELLFAEIELMQKRVCIFALPSMFIWNIYTFFQHVILIFWLLLEIRLTHFFLFRRPVQVLSAFYFKDFSA